MPLLGIYGSVSIHTRDTCILMLMAALSQKPSCLFSLSAQQLMDGQWKFGIYTLWNIIQP
jgi:hypothetical protein